MYKIQDTRGHKSCGVITQNWGWVFFKDSALPIMVKHSVTVHPPTLPKYCKVLCITPYKFSDPFGGLSMGVKTDLFVIIYETKVIREAYQIYIVWNAM